MMPKLPFVSIAHDNALSLVREKDIAGAIGELEASARLSPTNAQYWTPLAIALPNSASGANRTFKTLESAVAEGMSTRTFWARPPRSASNFSLYQQTLERAEALFGPAAEQSTSRRWLNSCD